MYESIACKTGIKKLSAGNGEILEMNIDMVDKSSGAAFELTHDVNEIEEGMVRRMNAYNELLKKYVRVAPPDQDAAAYLFSAGERPPGKKKIGETEE